MKNKHLSTDQIEKLHQFTKQHYVEFYDLQIELVDHLANGIEQQWIANNNISFEEALKIEFKKYGVFGFTELVEKRQTTMNKTYLKLVLKLMKEYFTIPKIFQTLTLVLTTYLILTQFPYSEYILKIILISTIVFISYKSIVWKCTVNTRKKNKEKVWLFENIINSCGTTLGLFQIIIYITTSHSSHYQISGLLNSKFGSFILSILLVTFIITAYILIIKIPKNAKQHIAKQHPEYKIA